MMRDAEPPAAGVNPRRRALLRGAIAIFVVLVIAGFVYAFVKAWRDTNGEFPDAWRIAGAGGLWMVGLLAAAFGWATLLGGDRRVDHGAALIVAQLGKYVPGAVAQATGQLGLARGAGVRLQRSVVAFSVQAIVQAAAGCTWVVVLAFAWTDAATAARILLGVGGVASLALIDRRWMVFVLRKIPRTREASSELVPPQRAIVLAWLASLCAVTASSGAYLLLLGSYGRVHNPWLVIAGFSSAWVVGFAAVPIPSGLGVREAVLVGILRGVFPSSVLVSASVYHRLVTIATEGLMAAIASHRLRGMRPARRVPVTSPGAQPDEPG